MTLKLKTVEVDGKTFAEIQDGKPVYLDGEKEIALDAASMSEKITSLNGEAMTHRKAKETAEAALKRFEGIEDPAAALKAMETMSNLDDKKLIDAGEVEKVKAATLKAAEEQWKPFKDKAEELESQLRQEKIGGSFARSKFIGEKMAVPVQMAEAYFGKHFSIEDGKMIAKDANGNEIFSKSSPGDRAAFEEALEILVDQSPFRDSILKGRGASGSGSNGGAGASGAKTISRDDFMKLAPAAQRDAVTTGGMTVTD